MSSHHDGSDLRFKQAQLNEERRKDERKLRAFDQYLAKILEQIHYINKLNSEKNVAEVENIQARIEKAMRKLLAYMNRDEAEMTAEAGQAQNPGDAIPLEPHPLLKDMGGMPMEIENLNPEFLEQMGLDPKLDKTEIENQIRNKLQAKLKLLNQLRNQLKNKLKAQPAYKKSYDLANKLVNRYKLALKQAPALKPAGPEARPRWTPPKLRPQ